MDHEKDTTGALSVDSGPGTTNGNGADLQRMQTTGSIVLTPEMFERMYLGPQNKVKGDLRSKFGNPTPVGLGGFLLAYCPLVITFMGWRGAGGEGAATVGTLYYMGGLLAILSSIGEWILGNTFPSTFFGVYGGFFLFYGATLTPSYGAYAAFASSPDNLLSGTMNPEFLASVGFVAVFMSIFSFYSTLCALRVNVLFTLAFALLTAAFGIFAAAEFTGAEGNAAKRTTYLVAAGATGFPVVIIGWYLLLAIMLGSVDFPLTLPVGDLSTIIKGGSEIQKAKKEKAARNGSA